jgi:hypothetical protein
MLLPKVYVILVYTEIGQLKLKFQVHLKFQPSERNLNQDHYDCVGKILFIVSNRGTAIARNQAH